MKVKTRRRKLPVTSAFSLSPDGKTSGKTGKSSSARPKSSARVIRRFHVLLKRKTQLEKEKEKEQKCQSKNSCTHDVRFGESDDIERKLREVENEMREMGGLEVYQRMSKIGQGKDRGGGSEGVFIGWMKELGLREKFGKVKGKEREKMKLLEVGALKPDNYASCSSWIDVLPIDLHATQSGIVEQDFLETDVETNSGVWDAISLSLVVNFVPEPRDRGRMLRLAYEMLRQDGLLFVALPLPCVSNSRYLTFEHLTQLMEHIGFLKVRERWKEGGKMGYWLFRKGRRGGHGSDMSGTGVDSGSEKVVRFDRKVVLREGKRNNFCILL